MERERAFAISAVLTDVLPRVRIALMWAYTARSMLVASFDLTVNEPPDERMVTDTDVVEELWVG